VGGKGEGEREEEEERIRDQKELEIGKKKDFLLQSIYKAIVFQIN